MLIYKIESFDGRVYIGQTTGTLHKRILYYRGDVSKYLRGKFTTRSKIIAALAKYEMPNFRFFIIDKAYSQKELDLKEKFWISMYNSTIQGIGFNIQLGGFGVSKHSENTKLIISKKSKGKVPYNKGIPSKIKGEKVSNAIFTQIQADQIREEFKIIGCALKIARKYNVSKTNVLNIIHNRTYVNDNYVYNKPIQKWYVYIIKSLKDNTLYTGITVDVEARLKTHNESRGARYTQGRTPFILIRSFVVPDKSSALKMEYKIKQMSKEDKLKYDGS